MTLSLTTRCMFVLVLVASILLSVALSATAGKRSAVPVPSEVARQMARAGEDVGDLRAETIDLNDDGTPELIVRGDCSVVGNCSTYVFRRTRRGYAQLLVDEAQMVRTGKFGIQKYRDILFQIHDSAYESHVSTYKFDGAQYHLKGCVDRKYSYLDKQGGWHLRKRPQITKC